jgi:DNA-binding LytR/AlgR family response regulator
MATTARAQPFPALVFVTAYDQYAVQAFEAQAVDYLLKPVQAARLAKDRGQTAADVGGKRASSRAATGKQPLQATLDQLRHLLAAVQGRCTRTKRRSPRSRSSRPAWARPSAWCRWTRCCYFEAADKYVRVLTADHEYLIRTPLKELLPQLDAQAFWQVHRGTVVRAAAIDTVTPRRGRQAAAWPARPAVTNCRSAGSTRICSRPCSFVGQHPDRKKTGRK